MSRIGKKPIPIESGAKVVIHGREVSVEGKNGKLAITHRPEVAVAIDEDAKEVIVTRDGDSKTSKAMHGLTRSLIANMIQGVTKGYTKELEVVGVGWTAKLQGRQVHLNVGYADTRIVDVPEGIVVEIAGQNVKVLGASKQLVGQVAARIRAHRKPEPYNGKGIKYKDEVILRKAGKAFGSGG